MRQPSTLEKAANASLQNVVRSPAARIYALAAFFLYEVDMRKLIARFLARLAAALNTFADRVEPILAPVEQAFEHVVEEFTTTIKDHIMAKQITDTGTATLALALLSAAGNPVANPITLTSSDLATATTTAYHSNKDINFNWDIYI